MQADPYNNYKMKAVIYLDPSVGRYIGQCLDYDIVGSGTTIPEVFLSITKVIAGHFSLAVQEEKSDIFEGVEKAPHRFWEMYESAQARFKHRIHGVSMASNEIDCAIA